MGYKYRSGLRPGTSKNLMIGPGALFTGFDLDNFDPTDINSFGTLVGATSGGNTVKLETEYHTAEIDGTLGPVEGAEWLTKAVAQISTNLLEITKENLMLKLPNFGISSHDEKYEIIEHDGQIAPTVSHDLALVGEITGRNLPVIVVLQRARAVDTFELPFGDGKTDVILKAEFESRLTEEDPTKIPFYILYPKGGSAVSMPTASVNPGTYTEVQTVALSAEAGATIYYTLDNSIPTPTTGTAYASPITIDDTTTIKAIAFKGTEISSVANFAYIINL